MIMIIFDDDIVWWWCSSVMMFGVWWWWSSLMMLVFDDNDHLWWCWCLMMMINFDDDDHVWWCWCLVMMIIFDDDVVWWWWSSLMMLVFDNDANFAARRGWQGLVGHGHHLCWVKSSINFSRNLSWVKLSSPSLPPKRINNISWDFLSSSPPTIFPPIAYLDHCYHQHTLTIIVITIIIRMSSWFSDISSLELEPPSSTHLEFPTLMTTSPSRVPHLSWGPIIIIKSSKSSFTPTIITILIDDWWFLGIIYHI